MPKPTAFALLLCLSSFFYLSSTVAATHISSAGGTASAHDQNWASHGRDAQETRFSPLNAINSDTVSALNLAWYVDLPDTRGLQATPLVVDGVMYVTGNWSVARAYNARTGDLLWEFDPKVDRSRAGMFCCGPVNRGVALWNNSVYLATLDGYLVAINPANGQERWRTLTFDRDHPYAITGAPRIAGGVVVIGNGGAEYGVRGHVDGYDAKTGERLWRFYTIPGDPAQGFESPIMEHAATTWSGHWWTMGGGGTVWDSLAYDAQHDLLYVGIGNGGPHNHQIRSEGRGDNLYLSSIVALRPTTGEYVWHHQQTPGDSWDYTATQHMVLADIQWQGEVRKVLMQAPKNGFFFVYDRITGELLSAKPYVPTTWATHYDLETGRPVETEDARYPDSQVLLRPSGLGGHNWHPMAWNPETQLMYIPVQDFPATFENEDLFVFHKNQWNLGYKVEPSSMNMLLTRAIMHRLFNSYVLAWNPIEEREQWRIPTPRIGNGGILTTAGNLVFQGDSLGRFKAFDARSGETLWDFDAQHAIIAPPISYAIDGEQYVSVLVGRGGGFGMAMGLPREGETKQRRLLSFKLRGTQKLPAAPKEQALSLVQPPPSLGNDASIARGGELYTRFCSRCHGIDVVSDGSVPDLRRLEHFWYDQFSAVVLQGSMQGMGMPGFADVLNEEDSSAIKHYVLDAANADWEQHQSNPWWLAFKKWCADIAAAAIVWLM